MIFFCKETKSMVSHINKQDKTLLGTYKRALFRRACFFASSFTNSLSSSDSLLLLDIEANRPFPMISVRRRTLVETVAPSLRFLPSLLESASFSVKSQSRPSATMLSVSASRRGTQSGARRSLGPTFGSRLLPTRRMPSCWKRPYEFLRVSLLTASKYERSPWWYKVLPSYTEKKLVNGVFKRGKISNQLSTVLSLLHIDPYISLVALGRSEPHQ